MRELRQDLLKKTFSVNITNDEDGIELLLWFMLNTNIRWGFNKGEEDLLVDFDLRYDGYDLITYDKERNVLWSTFILENDMIDPDFTFFSFDSIWHGSVEHILDLKRQRELIYCKLDDLKGGYAESKSKLTKNLNLINSSIDLLLDTMDLDIINRVSDVMCIVGLSEFGDDITRKILEEAYDEFLNGGFSFKHNYLSIGDFSMDIPEKYSYDIGPMHSGFFSIGLTHKYRRVEYEPGKIRDYHIKDHIDDILTTLSYIENASREQLELINSFFIN